MSSQVPIHMEEHQMNEAFMILVEATHKLQGLCRKNKHEFEYLSELFREIGRIAPKLVNLPNEVKNDLVNWACIGARTALPLETLEELEKREVILNGQMDEVTSEAVFLWISTLLTPHHKAA